MKDTLQKLVVGIVVAVFSALLGWAVAKGSRPEVQVQIDRPLMLSAERLTVFRIRNVGGAPASNIELRFISGMQPSSIVPITQIPSPSQISSQTIMSVPKLRPHDEISFYVKEVSPLSTNPRGLVEKAVYDEGEVGISTNDDRLNAYIREQRMNAGGVGFMIGVMLFSLMLIVGKLREKKPNQPLQPTPGG